MLQELFNTVLAVSKQGQEAVQTVDRLPPSEHAVSTRFEPVLRPPHKIQVSNCFASHFRRSIRIIKSFNQK